MHSPLTAVLQESDGDSTFVLAVCTCDGIGHIADQIRPDKFTGALKDVDRTVKYIVRLSTRVLPFVAYIDTI